MRIVQVSPEAAADGLKKRADRAPKTGLPPRSLAAKVQLEKLFVADVHKPALDALYAPGGPAIDCLFDADDEDAQIKASALLCAHRLDFDSRDLFVNKWQCRWTSKNPAKQQKSDPAIRMLLQCSCGYQHTQRASKERKAGVEYTGCLAHAEITYLEKSKRVVRVRGFLEHNDACKDAKYMGIPSVPVHPEVYEAALAQLRLGATLADVLERNQAVFRGPGYPSQPTDPEVLKRSKYRWELVAEDSRSLYRQYHRLDGVTVAEQPQINIDDWLDPTSPKYKPALRDAICHYQPMVEAGERFQVIISDREMKAAAWKYAHRSQLILDGTFGICNSKMLLFIVMGLDEKRKGVPLAFLLFSAPPENKKTCAGYDTTVLTELLTAWRDSLGTPDGQVFEPTVAITDTDLRERAALLAVWPRVCLLLCLFHLKQCWQNHRSRTLSGKAPSLARLTERMRRVENDLVACTDFTAAVELVSAERAALKSLRTTSDASVAKAEEHLEYLSSFWMQEALWKSWSAYRRQRAARLLGKPVDGVLTTTNHLEGFNRVLKKKHLHRYQRGRRLRIDILIHVLALKIIPAIFAQRRQERQREAFMRSKLLLLPGGDRLARHSVSAAQQVPLAHQRLAFLVPDADRDEKARALLENGQISTPQLTIHLDHFIFKCYSEQALDGEPDPTAYTVNLHSSGVADCSCADFRNRGGACKHMRAALLKLDVLRQQRVAFAQLPVVSLPKSLDEANDLQQSLANAEDREADDNLARVAASLNEMLGRDDPELFDVPASTESSSSGSDDGASSGTDAPAEDDSADEAVAETDEFDLVQGCDSHDALDQQIVSRISREFGRAVPKLGDLTELLALVKQRPEPTDDLQSARDCLAGLLSQIDRVLALPAPPAPPITGAAAPSSAQVPMQQPDSAPGTAGHPATRTGKRPFADATNATQPPAPKRARTDKSHLQAPPLEQKAQRRHKSHAVL